MDNYSNNSNLYEYISNPMQISNKKSLLNICLQITNAMLYLESINHIHKDLSCKNCIISIKLIIV